MTRLLRSMLAKRGVTLLEAVFTIIVAAILTAIMTNFFGEALLQSSEPVEQIKRSYYTSQVVEAIYNDYKKELANNPYDEITALATIKTRIGAPGDQSNAYGVYTVEENSFIEFNPDSGPSPIGEKSGTPAENNLLKVTLKSGTSESLTVLLTAKD